MRKHLLLAAFGSALVASVIGMGSVTAADKNVVAPEFKANGEVKIPQGWREWVFIGAPLTPNALNDGAAPFPEFHNVYIEPTAFEHWKKTGTFANGTQIAKELLLIRQKDKDDMNKDGSTAEVSGVGYFQGEFVGLELTVKDTSRYSKEPGGWAYFSFGHSGLPYKQTASAFPTDSCNACHEAAAEDDFVFTQFYPILKSAKP
jgi:Cytochrome P460